MPAEAKETLFRQISASLPVGRVGRPEEIGAAVLFLVENGFTTGAVLDVDGGAAVG
jgi:NAD(P)-dependent dehydrogenase (short-subunit alcohol dehydrogenase family)